MQDKGFPINIPGMQMCFPGIFNSGAAAPHLPEPEISEFHCLEFPALQDFGDCDKINPGNYK